VFAPTALGVNFAQRGDTNWQGYPFGAISTEREPCFLFPSYSGEMKRMASPWKRLLRDDSGITAIECALIAAIMSGVLVVVAFALGESMRDFLYDLINLLP
jgi:Flp pilus assembly pilin Flp